ncbi:hypothetical protein [Lutibaculum baratangense]|uniref:DUF1127 domain-containing protein n=1 Tax=Lutibaculum baratangense AMV1 TaxID=631454 RepID=V4RMR4_9HYPH|nr:hypothetical protein [Lutibaculum baratangense]ESR27316.1 hypothetical protein N177_0295 [Lutibaculum baratangense AMV1]
MATTYAHDHAAREIKASSPGLFSRILTRLLRAREAEARRRIAGYAHLIDAEALEQAGLTRAQMERLYNPYER